MLNSHIIFFTQKSSDEHFDDSTSVHSQQNIVSGILNTLGIVKSDDEEEKPNRSRSRSSSTTSSSSKASSKSSSSAVSAPTSSSGVVKHDVDENVEVSENKILTKEKGEAKTYVF